MSEPDKNLKTEEPIDTNAAPTIVAFTYQFERALYALFAGHAGKTRVGIETLDDVAELTLDEGGVITARLEQDAHSLQPDGHPFQDSSYKLWHTFRVWLSHIQHLRQTYSDIQFCLVTNTIVSSHALVQKLSKASSDREVKDAVVALRKQADAIAGKQRGSKKSKKEGPVSSGDPVSQKKSAAVTEASKVAEYNDVDLEFLIRGLALIDGAVSEAKTSLRETTIQRFVLPTALAGEGEAIYRALLGAIVDMCRNEWALKKTAWFEPQKFRDFLHKEIERRSIRNYLDRPFFKVDFKNLVEAGGREFYFLKQLSRLDLPSSMVDRHLDKYWAFYVERVRLEQEGFDDVDWDTREDSLYQRWQECRDSVELKRKSSPEITQEMQGQMTLERTLDDSFKAPLRTYETLNLYFTHGQYHHMANRPDHQRFVYWHPFYCPKKCENNEGET